MSNMKDYYKYDHTCCFDQEDPACGQKIDHLKCCICEEPNTIELNEKGKERLRQISKNPNTGILEKLPNTKANWICWTYDYEKKTAYLKLLSNPIHCTEEWHENVKVDLDEDRNIVGIEIKL